MRTAVHSLQRRVPATPQRQNFYFVKDQSFGASVVSLQKKAAVLFDKNNLVNS